MEYLAEARSKLAQGWTQNTDAIMLTGEYCLPQSTLAAAWCINGAIRAVCSFQRDQFETIEALYAVLLARDSATKLAVDPLNMGAMLAEWNDAFKRTHEEVLELFDDAIAAEKVRRARAMRAVLAASELAIS